MQSAFSLFICTLLSGSAPLSQKVSEFLQVGIQFGLIEGYGCKPFLLHDSTCFETELIKACFTATETAGNSTKMTQADLRIAGQVGPPQVSQMLKLVDVPELGYFSTDKPYPVGFDVFLI